MFGDPHYETFDGKMYDFQGECSHVMLTDKCPDSRGKKESIRIEARTTKCGSQGVTCTREVTVILHDMVFRMVRGKQKVSVTQMPLKVGDERAKFRLYQHAGAYVLLKTLHGIHLLWDNGTRLYIIAEPSRGGQICGLCGNYDENEVNDFVTSQGDIAGSALTFGDSWRTLESCPVTKEVKDPCRARPHRKDPAKQECSVIKSTKFQSCHHVVDPVPFYERCVYDACGCDQIGDCDCLCEAIAAYAKACLDEGVVVAWRKGHHICGKCLLYDDFYHLFKNFKSGFLVCLLHIIVFVRVYLHFFKRAKYALMLNK